ncbi:hypothetical protein H6G97_01035 [Nostoc flagelliforme FACHB-838]|uniref:Uncharacterized protein n=1 Tax=Nostoc flagelliforme FACHB-838 TaxID=2692904 RepID=A0ABR8DFK7_9NOSO|nr:hypothetical protein [Nostoc flagelliforme FACHB-838]
MSLITIQCRLVASEDTRRHLWQLMAEKNTPLINELLEQVRIHPDMEEWLKKGKLPNGVIKPLCDSLSTQERFVNQPKRFYKSAIEVVEYIYKSSGRPHHVNKTSLFSIDSKIISLTSTY